VRRPARRPASRRSPRRRPGTAATRSGACRPLGPTTPGSSRPGRPRVASRSPWPCVGKT